VVSRLRCLPQPGKAKSGLILDAFAKGHGHLEGTSFFGVVGIEPQFREAQKGVWWYGDNSYFDAGRGRFYRFTKNAFQLSTLGKPDYGRLKALGIEIQPWRRGKHIIVVEQSPHFLNLVGAKDIKLKTERPIKVRKWTGDKHKAGASLREDLQDAYCLVTHMSAAANEALLAGVPVVVGDCAAKPLSSPDIDHLVYPDNREEWAAGLAANQWTLEELRRGCVRAG
jgi:hypothetical protein